MPANTTDPEKRLWDAADDLRANSKLEDFAHGECPLLLNDKLKKLRNRNKPHTGNQLTCLGGT
jgi:hypothetical protein